MLDNALKRESTVRIAYGKTRVLKNLATKRCRISKQRAIRAEHRSKKRLNGIKTVTSEIQNLKYNLSVSHKENHSLKIGLNNTQRCGLLKEFKKIRAPSSTGKQGGGYIWPEWIQQLILEMLVNGTPPSTIRPIVS